MCPVALAKNFIWGRGSGVQTTDWGACPLLLSHQIRCHLYSTVLRQMRCERTLRHRQSVAANSVHYLSLITMQIVNSQHKR